MSWGYPRGFLKVITRHFWCKWSPLTGVQHSLLDLKGCYHLGSSVSAIRWKLGGVVERQCRSEFPKSCFQVCFEGFVLDQSKEVCEV